MSFLAAFWHEWGDPIQWAFGAVGGWAGAVGQYRLRSQSNRLTAGDQALRLLDTAQKRESVLSASYERVVLLEAAARAHAIASAETLQTVYEQAIGARLQVHALEAVAGHSLTEFPPLPPFPVAVVPPQSELADAPALAAPDAGTAPLNSKTEKAGASHD
ncbi:hypothetical protein GCM10007868_29990 [Gluconobacter frateurii]|uniref:Uncharacterized protein n=2 Tax=Gluconobacter frateurii TaxID=38308 RepID=A0ABQ0Q927_9PROT|nr:hypothetical protein AA0228_0713 [Gluconobacter frateurii NRIC 0228]GLP91924.1 hypothetical protein GCM10007868_29990 [Gluconobacter frateurii]